MANYSDAVKKVLRLEGGYQANPNDRGNYNSLGRLVGTNKGISAPVYESWIKRPPTVADMRAIDDITARTIYKVRYWDKIKGDNIHNQAVAEIFFDAAVNHGSTTAAKIMQEVLGVTPDGIVGAQTLASLNASNSKVIYEGFKRAREDFYYSIVANNPSQQVFLDGWLNRLDKFNDFDSLAADAGIVAGILILIGSLWFFIK